MDREVTAQVEQAERREQTAEPEHMIEMHMRQQNIGETAEAGPERSSWRCVPSPQSIRKRSLPALTSREGRPRSVEGVVAAVPRKVSSNMPH